MKSRVLGLVASGVVLVHACPVVNHKLQDAQQPLVASDKLRRWSSGSCAKPGVQRSGRLASRPPCAFAVLAPLTASIVLDEHWTRSLATMHFVPSRGSGVFLVVVVQKS
eukprot:scaffold7817_cov277-Pinguiococcus_pyrenoidosus.AAC.3